jgi:hypothetical protein
MYRSSMMGVGEEHKGFVRPYTEQRTEYNYEKPLRRKK